MSPLTRGLHHVTAIAGDPQRNVDFQAGVLGLRLVKRTVNFDDPGNYHLYFGDDTGAPGTLMTFFPWPGARRGRLGAGETSATAYMIPPGSAGWWTDWLGSRGVVDATSGERFGVQMLSFEDPEGMRLELVEGGAAAGWTAGRGSVVPAQHAIRGFHSVTLASLRADRTAELLTEGMGYRAAGEESGRRRFVAGAEDDCASAGAVVDLVETGGSRGDPGAGSVHHVAFRARDAAHQLEFRQAFLERGLHVTDVAERCYFQSVYFREPGGVLFEIATDTPGMMLDEPVESLGERLQLPPWYEPERPQLERTLPALVVPAGAAARP